MKKLSCLVIVFLFVLLIKHITAMRAVDFILECLSKEEQLLIHKGLSSNEEEKKVQLEIAQRGIICVNEKQTTLERLTTKLFGLHLFD